MARLDSVMMHASLREMDERLRGARFRRIQQVSRDLLLFTLWGPHRGSDPGGVTFGAPREMRFVVSVDPQSARIHMVDSDYGHADTPSAFCMLLRKHLMGATMELASTLGLDRVVRMEMSGVPATDEHEARPPRTLVVELLPGVRNVIVLDENDAVLGDLLGRRKRAEIYLAATPPKADALYLIGSRAVDAVPADEPLAKALPRGCFGIGPVYGREMAAMAGLDPAAPIPSDEAARWRLADAWDAFFRRLQSGALAPARQGDHLVPWPFESIPEQPEHYPTVGALLEEAYGAGAREAGLNRQKEKLVAAVMKQRDRALRRVEAQEGDLAEARGFDRWRRLGDLLTGNLHLVKPRAKSVAVLDYETGETVEVALDPDLSPQDNAQRYYARYKKARRGQEAIVEAIARSRQDVEYYQSLAAAIATALTRDELKEASAELSADNPAEASRAPRKGKAKGPAAKPRKYGLDGWDVLVGRNPRQNEVLTMKLARPEDMWLHARQIAGAHVIVRRGGKGEVPADVLEKAAALAARFSQSAADTRVPVDYTLVRYVKKPPGTPAGFVTYTRERTVTVDPTAADALESLRKG